jgi:hypothetical protein
MPFLAGSEPPVLALRRLFLPISSSYNSFNNLGGIDLRRGNARPGVIIQVIGEA